MILDLAEIFKTVILDLAENDVVSAVNSDQCDSGLNKWFFAICNSKEKLSLDLNTHQFQWNVAIWGL